MVSGSIKKLFSIDFVNIYLFSICFFNRFCTVEKFGVTPHCLYRDSLTLRFSEICLFFSKKNPARMFLLELLKFSIQFFFFRELRGVFSEKTLSVNFLRKDFFSHIFTKSSFLGASQGSENVFGTYERLNILNSWKIDQCFRKRIFLIILSKTSRK